MAFSLQDFARRRPWLYHLTAISNIAAIRRRRELLSTCRLLTECHSKRDARERRRESIHRTLGGQHILIRDQAPLHEWNIRLADGFTFADLVELLNRHVFFWPGTAAGPSDYGRRYYNRYCAEQPAMLRLPTTALLHSGGTHELLFCAYNSGAPRCSGGQRSPRGPELFLPADEFSRTLKYVVEVVVSGHVPLPADTETRRNPGNHWERLF